MNTLSLTSGFKKELWEFNKTLIWVPLTIAIFMILAPLVPILLVDNFHFEIAVNNLSQLENEANLSMFSVAVHNAMTAIFVPFMLVSLLIQLFYFTSCLFDERRDLSIVFWRSLPVSDAQTVVTKLLTGAVVIPLIFMLAATAVLIIALLLFFIACVVLSTGFETSLWWMWSEANIISSLAAIWLNVLPYTLWLFPLYAWLMLTSMFANKAPFLWAVLPIVVILLIESFLVAYFQLDTRFFADVLSNYVQLQTSIISTNAMQPESIKWVLFSMLSEKVSAVGILLGGVMMYATYWLRVNRSDQ